MLQYPAVQALEALPDLVVGGPIEGKKLRPFL
jgi:hypothetical protein